MHGRDGLGARRAERVRLRAAAALGERFSDVREHDSQPQPDRDRERVPGRLVSPAERTAAEHLDQPRDARDRRADLDHEHHGVADLDPRVELDQTVDQCAADDVPAEQGDRATLGHGWDLRRGHDRPPARRSRARFSSSTFTPEAELSAASTGTCAVVRPGSYGFSSARYALMFAAISCSVAMLFGPRLEKVVAASLSGGTVADGRV